MKNIEFFKTWDEVVDFLSKHNPGKDYAVNIFYSELNREYSVSMTYYPPLEGENADV